MDAHSCLSLLRDMRDVAFATVDETGAPQVRIIDVMLVEGERVYFCTARGKAFYRQLVQNPCVAVTGLNPQYQMVRLTGKAVKREDNPGWIDRIFTENPNMNEVYPGKSRCILEAFYIECSQVEFFDLGQTPIYRETFSMSGGDVASKGFYITQACIGCGKCAADCPQGCIEPGSPYRICQEHCLHCGLCRERCLAGSIEIRSGPC